MSDYLRIRRPSAVHKPEGVHHMVDLQMEDPRPLSVVNVLDLGDNPSFFLVFGRKGSVLKPVQPSN